MEKKLKMHEFQIQTDYKHVRRPVVIPLFSKKKIYDACRHTVVTAPNKKGYGIMHASSCVSGLVHNV